LLIWPSRKKSDVRLAVLERLSNLFEANRGYTEAEVNELLKASSLAVDHALLRRELFDAGFMDRTRDCRNYWRKDASP
jgi:hypothetical protein